MEDLDIWFRPGRGQDIVKPSTAQENGYELPLVHKISSDNVTKEKFNIDIDTIAVYVFTETTRMIYSTLQNFKKHQLQHYNKIENHTDDLPTYLPPSNSNSLVWRSYDILSP